MAIFAVSIKKELDWRGSVQQFSNVYHYKTQLVEPFEDRAVINAIMAAEKPVHAASVRFVEGRTWGPVGSDQARNVMREIVDLRGNAGSVATTSTMYKELAWLCVWPLGRYGVRNRPQFLRKWLHSCALLGASTSVQDGSTSTGEPGPLRTYMNAVRVIDPGLPTGIRYPLCSATGYEPKDAGYVYKFLEHHQLGR